VHIIHVGNMANKGTQALLKSDMSVIGDVFKGNVTFSVSTTDVEGVRRLIAPYNSVMPTTIDIPYERADFYVRRFGLERNSLRYKVFAFASLLYMFAQACLSIFSVFLAKAKLKPVYRGEILEHVKACDLVVSCSDENFKESASMLPLNVYWIPTWWSLLVSRTWEILLAKSMRKPVVVFPNSIGPFRTRMGRMLSRTALDNCDFILVRDPISYGAVKTLGVRSPVILTSDTTLLFNSTHKSSTDNCTSGLSDLNGIVGVSPGIYSHSLPEKRVHEYIEAHAKALDGAIEQYGFSVVFLPHYVSGFSLDDLEVCKLILGKMKNVERARIINCNTVEEYSSLIGQMDMIISSKMHPAVLAASSFVPSVCVAYDYKQTGFFVSLGLGDCVVPLNEFSCKQLSTKIDYVWTRRSEIRGLLKKRVPDLQKQIRESITQAVGPFIELCVRGKQDTNSDLTGR